VLDEIERGTGRFHPPEELLSQTIDAVFWASLSQEEGKSALARVQFADIRDPYCCLEPREVTAEAVRKLSPLLDIPSNALFIRRDAMIVGVGPWQTHDFGIIANRPGRLAVLDGDMVLGVFDKGDWVIVGGSSVNAGQILQGALSGTAFPDRFRKAGLILRLAMQARRAGRGATFVLLPADRQDGIGSISYPVDEFSALSKALEEGRDGGAAPGSSDLQNQMYWVHMQREARRALVRTSTAIAAAGAGIDGATLIDEVNLRLPDFGAKIDAPDDGSDLRLIELPSTNGQLAKRKDIGGMRHQTASRLVQRNHDATVITVSQDGPVSLFAWVMDDARVLMIKHLDRYLEAEAGFD
jgi:hypothetical protein